MTNTANNTQPHAARWPVRRSDVTDQELDGEALVYDPVTADTHRLNETAYFIWRSCDGQTTTERIAEQLTELYDVDPAEAIQHASRMVDELIERGLVFTDPMTAD